jgi:hypothetical protein
VADDVVLIASELAANAVLHSGSAELYFTVRAEIHPLHIRVECEDLGGPWGQPRMVNGEPQCHGLDIVAALSEDWGTEERTCDNRRIVWAQIAGPRYTSAGSALGHLIATWPADCSSRLLPPAAHHRRINDQTFGVAGVARNV